jgi:hypothetical protein
MQKRELHEGLSLACLLSFQHGGALEIALNKIYTLIFSISLIYNLLMLPPLVAM